MTHEICMDIFVFLQMLFAQVVKVGTSINDTILFTKQHQNSGSALIISRRDKLPRNATQANRAAIINSKYHWPIVVFPVVK